MKIEKFKKLEESECSSEHERGGRERNKKLKISIKED